MKVDTPADVACTDGTMLKESEISGVRFNCYLDWPNQDKPPYKEWKVWWSFLKGLLMRRETDCKTNTYLGIGNISILVEDREAILKVSLTHTPT